MNKGGAEKLKGLLGGNAGATSPSQRKPIGSTVKPTTDITSKG